MKQTAEEIRQKITDIMVKAISEGTPPWRKPWSSGDNIGLPCNFVSGRRYTGINSIILMFMGMKSLTDNTPVSKFWGTSNSWVKNCGGHVKKGEKATAITLFTMVPKRDKVTKQIEYNSKGEPIKFPLMREYYVFNISQIQAPAVTTLLGSGGLMDVLMGDEKRKNLTARERMVIVARKYLPVYAQPDDEVSDEKFAKALQDGIRQRLDRYMVTDGKDQNHDPDFGPAEKFIEATGAVIKHGKMKACYTPSLDVISMPGKTKFKSIANYYETAFHELIHWGENSSRVGHKVLDEKSTAEEKYAFNELVAEMGACMLMAELNVPMADQMLESSKSYVASWLKKMGSDTKFIFDAATQSSKVVDYLLACIGKQNPEFVPEDADEEQAAA